jgi:hypothetical protein
VLQSVTTEIANRELSRREEMRVGATVSYAMEFIHERLERGDHPREDRFFTEEKSGTSRSPSSERISTPGGTREDALRATT